MKAAIVGVPGLVLDAATAALLRAHRPIGVILFGRNVESPAQLVALTAAVRACLPPAGLLLVDQEGGRVARLRPPHWRAHPAAGRISDVRTAWLTGALIGLDCAAMGFDVVCAPVLDLALPGRHEIVGDRGYGADSEIVARLGRAMADGLHAGGVVPVMKHMPGHGRARVDTHLSLSVVDDAGEEDLVPFIRNADLPWGMTAHILFPALDPVHPATLSRTIIEVVIRGRIGFGGVLVSDDLAMGALQGTPAARAVACLAAGCDIAMYCAGDAEGTASMLEACPPLSKTALERLARARPVKSSLDAGVLAAERDLSVA